MFSLWFMFVKTFLFHFIDFFFFFCKQFSRSLRTSLSPGQTLHSFFILSLLFAMCVRIFLFFMFKFFLCILFITVDYSLTSPVAVKLLVGDLFDLSIVFVLATCVCVCVFLFFGFISILILISSLLPLHFKSKGHLFNAQDSHALSRNVKRYIQISSTNHLVISIFFSYLYILFSFGTIFMPSFF